MYKKILIALLALTISQTYASGPEALRAPINLTLPGLLVDGEDADDDDAAYPSTSPTTAINPYWELVNIMPEPSRTELFTRVNHIPAAQHKLILEQGLGYEGTVILYGIAQGKIKTVQAIIDSLPETILEQLCFLEKRDARGQAHSLITSGILSAIKSWSGDAESLQALNNLYKHLIAKAFPDPSRKTTK